MATNGTLDERIVGRLEELFGARDHVDEVHEVAIVTVLVVRVSRKPGGEEGMIRVQWPEDNSNVVVVQIEQLEGVALLIALEPSKGWLVNQRIDLMTWNELYK